MRVVGVGVLTGWGTGVEALPDDAGQAAGGRRIVPLAARARDEDRFRRATRECLLAVDAVDAMLGEARRPAEDLRGEATALLYVTAAAYGASNRAFIEGGTGALHFPYTAPSAVAAQVAIEYGLAGGYVILVGGASATVDALWQASVMLQDGRCDRALVLAVETFEECADLWARGRWLPRAPLVEAAACVLLEGDGRGTAYASGPPSPLEERVVRRAGETLSCAPLLAIALAREARARTARLTGEWRGRRAGVTLDVLPQAVSA